MSETATLPVGSLIVLHQGEYSDKDAAGPFTALKPFNLDSLLAEFRAQWKPKYEWDDHPRPDEFEVWLVSSGHLEEIKNVTHWHIGSYRSIDLGKPWTGGKEYF